MIIDKKDIYHLGASLKDLGKKWFAFSKFEMNTFEVLARLKQSKTLLYLASSNVTGTYFIHLAVKNSLL